MLRQSIKPHSRLSSIRRVLCLGTGLTLIGVMLGCSTPMQLGGVGPGDAVDAIRNTDLTAHFPIPAGGTTSRGQAAAPMLFPGGNGSGDSQRSAPYTSDAGAMGSTPGASNTADGIELNFDSADIQTVAKALISDALGLNFVIDPRVQGNITLVSAGPIPKKDLLSAFEDVLRMSSGALLREGNVVKIIPLNEAAGAGPTTLGANQPGFGATVIPLHFTSAAGLAKTAENFLSRPGAIRADTTHNLLLIQGTQSERQGVVDMVKSFDVEWLRNQSVGIYPLKSTSPDTIIRELDRLFETAEGGQGQGTVSFQPIARMNAVMAVARSQKVLAQVTQWVKRLDREDVSGTTIRIYRLEHGNAPKVAKILNDIFVGKGGSSSSADSAANQIAPGANGAQSKLDSINAANSSSGGSNSSGSNSSSGSSAAGGAQLSTNGLGSGSQLASSFQDFAEGKGKNDSGSDSSGSLPRGVFQNVRITADTTNNSVVIYSNQEDYRVIERSLRELDRAQLQVAIEATIAEVTLTDALQYGVQYYLGSTDVHAGTNNGSISLTTSAATAAIAQALPGLNVLLGNQASPKVVLSALSTLTAVKVLSAPSLVVTDNQPAFLQVGDSVPISTGSATVLSSSNTIVNTITMQDTGVILKVWPHIHANGTVELEIEQEVSSVVGGVSSTNLNPTISQRRIHSTIAVPTGQTVLLGGLMSEEDDKTQAGIPVLRQIQGLGDLFGNTNGTKTRTEIIVFVKPSIIQNAFDAQNVAQEFRAGLSSMHTNSSVFSGKDTAPKGSSSAAR